MSMQLWLTLGVFGGCLGLMIFTRIGPDLVLTGGLTALLAFGVLTPKDALAGFANEGILTIGVLFMVAAGSARDRSARPGGAQPVQAPAQRLAVRSFA